MLLLCSLTESNIVFKNKQGSKKWGILITEKSVLPCAVNITEAAACLLFRSQKMNKTKGGISWIVICCKRKLFDVFSIPFLDFYFALFCFVFKQGNIHILITLLEPQNMEIEHQRDLKTPSNACWKVSAAGATERAFAIFSTNICSISHLVQETVAACINIYLRLKRANFEVSPSVGVYRARVSGERLPVHQLAVANLNSARQNPTFPCPCS